MILISQDGLTTIKPEAVTIEGTVKGTAWTIYAWVGGRSFTMSRAYRMLDNLSAAYSEIQARMNEDGAYRIRLPEEGTDGEAVL